MRIHLTGAFEHMDGRVGFGNAAVNINAQFQKAGIKTYCKNKYDDSIKNVPVEMCFDQPQRFKFSCPGAYQIGYVPWESTELMPGWHATLRSCNEIWTPNEFGRKVFSHHFPDKEVFVYQHGVSQRYRPKKRKLNPDKPFTFLFIGEPQSRKDGQAVVNTFIRLFKDNPEYRLIVKATHINTITVMDPKSKVMGSPDFFYENIFVYTKMLDDQQMIELYNEADVFVYPSWGEGWGFNPLQALAMGIPTISTHDWSDYAEYITVPIDSKLVLSPWQDLHPGMMYRPDYNQLYNSMKNVKQDYSELASIAFRNSFKIHEKFNWEKVSIPAVERIQKIFSTLESKTLAC